MRKLLIVGLASAAALGSTIAGAQLSLEEGREAQALRQSVFELLSYNAERLNLMARGFVPFDAGQASLYAERIAGLAAMIPDVSATDTRGSGAYTRAKDFVWDNWDTYVEYARGLELAANEAKEALASGDGTAMRSKVRSIGQACGMCHDLFRFQLSDPGFPFQDGVDGG